MKEGAYFIAIYICAFIFVLIIGASRVFGKNIDDYMPQGNIFYGIKSYWGYVHILLYTILGYTFGLKYAPASFVVSNVFEILENVGETLDLPHRSGIGIDTMIDMSGYLLGCYLKSCN